MKKEKLNKPYTIVIFHNDKPVKKKRFISLEKLDRYCDHVEKLGKTYGTYSINAW
ncbi:MULTISPECIES: hypothetical protein [Bacillaceae]|uniref:hypothetical protein n=1 Tax=Bacillaceae TaxID=186817 RepID=UPI0002FEBC4C|nr:MULTISPECIES: hypothetical protein [Bacillaceae]MCF2648875.1 hypothetical protein [Niallia circulans]CAI9397118.1 hypothetical protein BACSP_04481 [Bacillus sp. T2.9-1]SLL37117.1 Uncharacterised protein [Mycobacteroides abscessus subsp. abscessus]HEO8422236.1 hypothetical protein [Yersinia enterocolitica]